MGNFLSSFCVKCKLRILSNIFHVQTFRHSNKKSSPKQMSFCFLQQTRKGLRSRNCPLFLRSSTWTDSDPNGGSGFCPSGWRGTSRLCTSAAEISPRRRGRFFSIEGRVLGSDVDKSGRNIFLYSKMDLLVKVGKVKLFFLKIYKGNGVVWCLYVCFCIIFCFHSSSECKTKKRCTKMPGHFFDLSSIWVYMKRFPLNMGPLGPVGPSPGSDWWGWPFETEVVAPKR